MGNCFKNMKKLIFFAVSLLLVACNQTKTEPVVQVSSGMIEGVFSDGVFAFKGIPYAKAVRFQPCEPADAWEGVRECKEYGPYAKQAGDDVISVEGEGDFLANVWTKGLNDGAKRPIMFWIHGGGFFFGAANADPTDGVHLAQKDVVVVSINHRLDVLGFLDLSGFGGKWEKSVNLGMFDIIAALKWVRDNAEAFGGDPENITVFGESGGGGKIATLLCMPDAKGTFDKAIIQSGARVNKNTGELTRQLGKNVVEALGLTAETMDELQTIPYDSLLSVSHRCQVELLGAHSAAAAFIWGYAPTADGVTLLQQPYTPGFASIADNVPLMIGSTFNELETKFYNDSTLTEAKADSILTAYYGDRKEEFVAAFKEAYPEITLSDMLGIDSNIRAYSLAVADSRSAIDGAAPVYEYLLTWVSDYDPEGSGCYHSLDIPLSFNNPYDERHQVKDGDPKAQLVSDRMSDLWVSFAKTGKPSAEGVPEWIPYTTATGATMIFDNEFVLKNNFDRKLQDILYSRLK